MFLLYTFIHYFLIRLVNEYFYMFVSENALVAQMCICKEEYLIILFLFLTAKRPMYVELWSFPAFGGLKQITHPNSCPPHSLKRSATSLVITGPMLQGDALL